MQFIEIIEGKGMNHFVCNAVHLTITITLFAAENGSLKLMNTNDDIEHFTLDYSSILTFITGASYPPPIGFSKTYYCISV